MKEDVFETVLNDVLEELKKSNGEIKNMQSEIAALKEKVETFDGRLNEQVVAAPADTQPIQQIITEGYHKIEKSLTERRDEMKKMVAEGFQKVSAIVEAQPKAIVRRYQVALFPENDPHGNYKFAVTRFLRWAAILAAMGVLLRLGTQWLDNIHSERQLQLQLQSKSTSFQKSYPEPLPPHPAASPSKRIHKQPDLPGEAFLRSTTPDSTTPVDSTGAP